MRLPSKTRHLSLLTLLTLSGLSYADDQSPWLVRFRFLDIGTQQSNNTSTAGKAAGITTDSIQVSGQTQPEIDLSYFFTNHISAELVGSFPVSHSVSLNNADIGNFQELPPTLNLQYHFTNFGHWMPYVGAGVADMRTFNTNLVANLGLTENNWGEDLQVGMDYALDDHWLVNFDIKKYFMNVGVTSAGSTIATLHPNPYLIGFGVGYRF